MPFFINSQMAVRKRIFEDTLNQCASEPMLREAIRRSRNSQFVSPEGPMIAESGEQDHRYDKKADIIVSAKRSYEAARAYRNQGKKICVLNFANAFSPGGGVKDGCSAQEESLCRCSTLYPCIAHKSVTQYFYEVHRAQWMKGKYTNLANADCIYTPGVVVIKSDVAEPELLPQEEWYEVDVITCAAPDLRESLGNRADTGSGMPDDASLQRIHEQRGRRILEIARRQQADILILGAFGCGAFENHPEIVARAYKKILKEYVYDFDTIEFAIAGAAGNNRNYEVFDQVIDRI
jgi:uncharacterized protein (TIGR02452 family)